MSVEPDRDDAGRVAEVPQHQRSGVMGEGGDGIQVGNGAGLEPNVGERNQSHLLVLQWLDVIDVGSCGRIDAGDAKPAPGGAGHGVEHVEIRWEIGVVRDDVGSSGRSERSRSQLEQIHRGLIADQHLARCRADDGGEQVADLCRKSDPLAAPGANEAATPLVVKRASILSTPSTVGRPSELPSR